MNLGLFLLGIPIWGLLLGLSGAFDTSLATSRGEYLVGGSLVWQQMLIDAGVFWLGANLVLGLFNMLPFGPLDGAKVKDWNESAFYAVISLFALLVLTWVPFGYWSPLAVLESIANLI